ncbi:unnamed protein product [Prunus armeniaca]
MVICQVRCFKTDLSLSPLRPSAPPGFSPPAVASSSHQHRHTPRPATGPVRLGPPSPQPSVPPHPSPWQQLRPPETARKQSVFDRIFELLFSVVRPPNRTSELGFSRLSGHCSGHFRPFFGVGPRTKVAPNRAPCAAGACGSAWAAGWGPESALE